MEEGEYPDGGYGMTKYVSTVMESYKTLCLEQERKRIKQPLREMMESADSQAQVFENKGMQYGALSYQAMASAYQIAESKI